MEDIKKYPDDSDAPSADISDAGEITAEDDENRDQGEAGETTVIPIPVDGVEHGEGVTGGAEDGVDSEGGDGNREARRRLRPRAMAAIAALSIAIVAGGAWAYLSAQHVEVPSSAIVSAPTDSEEHTVPERRQVRVAIDTDGVLAIINDMGLPKTSKVTVDVSDRLIVVTEKAELVDKLVAERTYDRSYALASRLEESQAESVTWLIDNGKGATAAVTVDVVDGRDEATPTDIAGKLASAKGYSLNEGAYKPIKSTVSEPAAGVVPKAIDGKALVTPANKDEASNGSGGTSRTPTTEASSSQSSSASRTDGTQSSSGTSMTRPTGDSSRTPSSSTLPDQDSSQQESAEPVVTRQWVEEQGHYEDVYETQKVKTGTRWVVDQEAWDEETYADVTVWYTSDGLRFESVDEVAGYCEDQLVNHGVNVSYGSVVESVPTGVVHHDEQGHYEDVYEEQQVLTGSRWVVDVEGHWE